MQKLLTFIIFFTILFFTSCNRGFYPTDMYKVKDKKQFSPTEDLLEPVVAQIKSGDKLSISVYSNKGEKILIPLETAMGQPANGSIVYTVDDSGYVDLPKIGRTQIANKTIKESERELVSLFADHIVDPYISIWIENKRVFFITGGTLQDGKIIPYTSENMTLIDILSSAGGIREGKAYSIRLLRQQDNDVKIYNIDLSDFSQAKYSFINVLPNDIIYVEPVHRPFRKFLDGIMPYLTLVSTGLLIYTVFVIK